MTSPVSTPAAAAGERMWRSRAALDPWVSPRCECPAVHRPTGQLERPAPDRATEVDPGTAADLAQRREGGVEQAGEAVRDGERLVGVEVAPVAAAVGGERGPLCVQARLRSGGVSEQA